jgi:hypothetical protein
MMKKVIFTLVVIIGMYSNHVISQNILAGWNYNTITGTPAAPIADIGTGTSSFLGSLVVAAAATGMDPVINNGCGAQNGNNPGAWAFTATPGATNESSGVQYMASTVGSSNIAFTWDQRSSNTATNTMRVKYTTDGTTWNDFTMTASNTTFCNGSINANGCFENSAVGDQYRRVSLDFSTIPSVNNNPNFGVRILAAHYQATGQFRQTGNTSVVATGGTWRFDNVKIEGRSNISIVAASNFVQYNENIGVINVPITVSNANNSPIDLTFSLSTYSDASPNNDYTWTNTLTIPANTNGVSNLPITIIDDALSEHAERIIVKISSGLNAQISTTNNYQIIFIKDNDYQAPTPTNELNLNLLTSFSNGVAGSNSAEIVSFDSSVDRLYIANSIGGKLDIVNFSNPAAPFLINSISLLPYGNINSVVAHDSIIALAIESVPAQTNGKVVFMDYNGNFISQVTVGAMPDMITFNKDYSKILTANEGEPDASYANDPEGSVSIIDLTPGYANLTNANVTNIGFLAYNGQSASLIAQGIRVFATSASVAQDFEPEYIAISDDNTKAYVTLQENNAMLTIDLASNSITSLVALGFGAYDAASGNALDASDQSGAVLITGNIPVKAAYMPDAIDFYSTGGTGYLVMANEGDSREFGSVIDANRISSSTFNALDATVFPDQAILRNNKFLGRLSALKYSGDTDGDGDYDELHIMGGRSFSIRNAATGAIVFDSKALMEQITANHPTFGAIFNASNATGAPALKNRSDDKGPEPEGIKIAQINGKMYAFVALERIGGAMMFNVTNPNNPIYVGYANNRSTTLSGPDLGAEGIIYISAAQSPNGNAILILANEVSSTLSIYQINSCAELSGAPISTQNNTICVGQNTSISATPTANVSYEWLQNNLPIQNANQVNYAATTAGTYSLKVTNSTLNCVDTTNSIQITVNALPIVSAGQSQSVCTGASATLNGSGASTYTWNNNVTNGVAFTPAATQTYTVTGTDVNGCQNTAQVIVTVNALPVVSAGQAQTVCSGAGVTLNGSGASTYTWNNNVTNGVAFTPVATQTYTVTGTDVNGCQGTSQVTVTVNTLPVVSAGQAQTLCAGASATLNGSGASSYTWNNNVTNGVAFTPQATQTYTVTGTDANGCQNTAQVIVTVNNLPVVSAGQTQTLCVGASVTLNGSGASTYSWDNNVTNGVSFTPNTTQTYTVTGIDVNGCQNTAQVSITVNPLPTVNAGSTQNVCPGVQVTLTASGASTYVWDNNISNGQAFTPNASGIYTVIGTDLNGCNDTAQVSVNIYTAPSVDLGNDTIVCEYNFPYQITATGTPGATYTWDNGATGNPISVATAGAYTVTATNNSGCTSTDVIVVESDPCAGIIEQGMSIILYPNPFNENVQITSTESIDAQLEVYGSDGRIVYATRMNGQHATLSLTSLARGNYMVKIVHNGTTHVTKLVKQ